MFRFFKTDPSEEQIKKLTEMLGDEVSNRITSKLTDEFEALASIDSATEQVTKLKQEIAVLQAQRSGIEETYARKEREIEHKVGLLRTELEQDKKQQEKEFELQVQAAKLEAKEVGLVERERAFAEKMSFIEKRFTEEVGYLKTLVEDMAKRLPDATILATKTL